MAKLFRNTVTGKTSGHIYNVTSNPLTLDRSYVAGQAGGKTLFEEIVTVPYERVLPPLYLEGLMEITPQTKRVSLPAFMDTFVQTLTTYIEKVWNV